VIVPIAARIEPKKRLVPIADVLVKATKTAA
jgi:hypothetical protein